MEKEAKARVKINKLLEQAGWRFFKDECGPATIKLESNVKHEELGDDFEHAGNGYVDYLLLDGGGFPVCMMEAFFSVLDTYNNECTTNFYLKNGFKFLTDKDKDSDHRAMYFDLMPIANYLAAMPAATKDD